MVKVIIHTKETALKGKNSLLLGTKFFPLREIPNDYEKGTRLMRISGRSCSLPVTVRHIRSNVI